MTILLGSGGFRTDERRARLTGAMRDVFGDIERVLFVPYALADHDRYVRLLTEKGLDAGYRLEGIHTVVDPIAAIESADAIYVGGGNSFRLTAALHEHGLLDPIRRAVRGGTPYLGVSAGSNVACPTLMTTNDMPIVFPPSFETLGLVEFQINPHYYPGPIHYRESDGELREHFGETRDDRIREYHEEESRTVIGLREGSLLRVEDGALTLIGDVARVFVAGQEPRDVVPGEPFDPFEPSEPGATRDS